MEMAAGVLKVPKQLKNKESEEHFQIRTKLGEMIRGQPIGEQASPPDSPHWLQAQHKECLYSPGQWGEEGASVPEHPTTGGRGWGQLV